MIPTALWRGAFVMALSAAALGCKQPAKEGTPIAWAEVSKGTDATPGITPPLACSHKGDGKVYAAEGFAHWAETNLCRNDECYVNLFQTNEADGSPHEDRSVGYVPLIVGMKGVFGGYVEKPDLANATSGTTGVTSNRERTTTGSLVPDSLKLHLSDGSVVNNRVRIRAFFEIVDTNGVCELKYRGGQKV